MVQTEIRLISKDEDFNKELWPYALIFNEYFGSGLSSIIFQEIREAKGLAYSAYSAYSMANEAGKPSYVQAYVGTQRDKLTEALVVLLDLMNNMPQAPDQFEDAKAAALKKIESDRIVGRNVFFKYLDLKRRGIDYDVRKEQYETIQNMTLESLNTFFAEHIKGKKFSFLVIGNKAEMDMESLEKLGPVQELSLEELFGY
jgi:predicted Zn-dependent peptidase